MLSSSFNLLRNVKVQSLYTSAVRLCSSNSTGLFCKFPIPVILCFKCCLFPGFIDYEEFKKHLDSKSIVYLDVRSRNELKNDGVIAGSVNIPCNLSQLDSVI